MARSHEAILDWLAARLACLAGGVELQPLPAQVAVVGYGGARQELYYGGARLELYSFIRRRRGDEDVLTKLCSSACPVLASTASSCKPQESASSPQCAEASEWKHMHESAVEDIKVAMFPLGSIENHGPHLPLGTDLMLAESIVKAATAGLESVYSLPASPFGASSEHANRPGTIAVRDGHLNGLWNQVLASVVNTGIYKVILVNGHGGQTANVDIAVRHARFKQDALVVAFNVQAALAEAWRKAEDRQSLVQTETAYGIHGGLIETSVMLHLFPELVKKENAKDFKPRRAFQNSVLQPYGTIVSYGWRSEDICEAGAVGDASSATSELGQLIFEGVVNMLRSLVVEVRDADVADVLPGTHG